MRFEDLTQRQQRAVIGVAVATGIWQLWMLWDLWRRPGHHVRGDKRWWVAASFVRPFGQLAYHRWGRRPPPGGWPPDPTTSGGTPPGSDWFDDVEPDDLAG